jgi:hypothetical protein
LNRREGKLKALKATVLSSIVDRALESEALQGKISWGKKAPNEVLELLKKFRTDVTDGASQGVRAKSIRL